MFSPHKLSELLGSRERMGRQGTCSYVGIMASTPFPSFLAPIVYLEAFPRSACAGLFLRHRECLSVRRDAQQNTVRLQL